MPLDLWGGDTGFAPAAPIPAFRADRGRRAYLSGLAAEDSVVRHLETRGLRVVARRWRGAGAEIDIIARDGKTFVFVEVKKSRSHAQAAAHFGPAQQRRIWAAAEAFLALSPQGSLSEVRIDVALVDQVGRVEMVENALMGF